MNKKPQEGFLLLELIVVIGLLMIILSIGTLNICFLDKAILRIELEKLYNVCLYFQNNARIENKRYTLYFDEQKKTYTCEEQQWSLSDQIIFGAVEQAKGPPSSPHSIIKNGITFQRSCIIFSPEGIIQSGTVYLTDINHRYSYALSCPIGDYSYIRRYRYDTQWQLMS